MSFMDEVPAQFRAVEYLNAICPLLKGSYYLGGHSKSGNLAVYNNDGPGFHSNFIHSAGYRRIVNRVRTFFPRSSVIGMILEHSANYSVVTCNETGLMQHNPFTWGVEGTCFACDRGIAKNSIELNNTIRAWLEDLSPEKRAEFVNTAFDVIQATGTKTFEELSSEKLKASVVMIKSFNHLDFQTRLHLINVIMLFFKESRRMIKNTLITDVEAFLYQAKNQTTFIRRFSNKKIGSRSILQAEY